jgi:lipopolysaccharide export system ATP-binding protein
MIKAINLIKYYGNRAVLKGIDINISQGEIVGFLGPNGAGKTTAFSIILGLIDSDRGNIFYDDTDISEYPMYKRAQLGMALLPQEYSIFRELSTMDNLLTVLENSVKKSSKRAYYLDYFLSRFGLIKVKYQLAKTLSGGEKRRLEIARALANFPKYIFMDEPFTGIDPITINDIQKIIRELKAEGIGLVISDHNIRDTLKITDRAYIMVEGEILKEGIPADLVEDPIIKEKYLGKEIKIN